MQTILCAVDGSGHARKAIETAADLASGLNTSLVLVTVDEPGPLKGEVALFADAEKLDRGEVIDRVLDSAQAHAAKCGVSSITTKVAGGDPVDGILKTASQADAGVIVLGARGLSTVHELMFGSVSHKILHLADRPVMVVKS